MTVKLLVGDVREKIKQIPDGSIDLVACSPPFLALRKYGDNAAEMGSERTPADFLDALLELTQEFRRVLTPHGSIAIELGDCFSGSSREERSDVVNATRRWGGDDGAPTLTGFRGGTVDRQGIEWPLPKSLCMIPTLYPASLAYGWNMLNPVHTFPRWRVRNVIVWARPNPPVGALGDKVRPATSYITVACTSAKRYFDLDAVREPGSSFDRAEGERKGKSIHGLAEGWTADRGLTHNPAGAPPLDWWEDDFDPDDEPDCLGPEGECWDTHVPPCPLALPHVSGDPTGHATLVLPTQPYPGAHYATWPETLAARLIKMMCPLRVCMRCGEPSRRIVGDATYVNARSGVKVDKAAWNDGDLNRQGAIGRDNGALRNAPTLGWSDCSHNAWRPGMTLDPFAGSGTTLAVAQGLARDATGIELYDENAWLCRERIGMFLEVVA